MRGQAAWLNNAHLVTSSPLLCKCGSSGKLQRSTVFDEALSPQHPAPPRVFIIGVGEADGGAEAAEWWSTAVEVAIASQAHSPHVH